MYPHKGVRKHTPKAEPSATKSPPPTTFEEIITSPIKKPIQPPLTQPSPNFSNLFCGDAPMAREIPAAKTIISDGTSK